MGSELCGMDTIWEDAASHKGRFVGQVESGHWAKRLEALFSGVDLFEVVC